MFIFIGIATFVSSVGVMGACHLLGKWLRPVRSPVVDSGQQLMWNFLI